jgi:hypothetical protein
MEQYDAADGVDDVVRLDDLSLRSLIALVERLKVTETTDHYLCRELELDMAFFWADENLKAAKRPAGARERIVEATEIRDRVLSAHDFVGKSNVHAAIEELNKVIELKMGL